MLSGVPNLYQRKPVQRLGPRNDSAGRSSGHEAQSDDGTHHFRLYREVLIPNNAEKVPLEELSASLQFAMSFQQYTGPVQAKGLEDTAFYRYNASPFFK